MPHRSRRISTGWLSPLTRSVVASGAAGAAARSEADAASIRTIAVRRRRVRIMLRIVGLVRFFLQVPSDSAGCRISADLRAAHGCAPDGFPARPARARPERKRDDCRPLSRPRGTGRGHRVQAPRLGVLSRRVVRPGVSLLRRRAQRRAGRRVPARRPPADHDSQPHLRTGSRRRPRPGAARDGRRHRGLAPRRLDPGELEPAARRARRCRRRSPSPRATRRPSRSRTASAAARTRS